MTRRRGTRPRVVKGDAQDEADSRWFEEVGPDPAMGQLMVPHVVADRALRRHDNVTSGPRWRRKLYRALYRARHELAWQVPRRRRRQTPLRLPDGRSIMADDPTAVRYSDAEIRALTRAFDRVLDGQLSRRRLSRDPGAEAPTPPGDGE